jgi:ribonuclease HI
MANAGRSQYIGLLATMYFDSSKCNIGAGAVFVLISPQGDKMKYVLRMNFLLPTNNEAEYEALAHGMRMAKACGATRLEIYGDSSIVVHQSMNLCDAVIDNMIAYREMYRVMEGKFEGCKLKHIGRASNEEVDNLANIGSTCSAIPDGVFYKFINQHSIKVKTPAPPTQSTTDSGAAPEEAVENVIISPSQHVLLFEPVLDSAFSSIFTTAGTTRRPSRGTVHRTPIQSIHGGSRRALQRKYIRHISTVHLTRRWKSSVAKIHEGTCGHHARS